MRFDLGAVPWAPSAGASLGEAWHFWDHPRWGHFEVAGERVAFHRHESVGDFNRGPSLWTYRSLDEAGLAALSLPRSEWGAPWQRAYTGWLARTPACAWALADHDLGIVRFGELTPPVLDDDAWAASFWRGLGLG